MTFDKCEYRSECKHYDKDAICCTFLYKLCSYGKHYEKLKISQQAQRLINLSGQNNPLSLEEKVKEGLKRKEVRII